jgi:hypothetical protein
MVSRLRDLRRKIELQRVIGELLGKMVTSKEILPSQIAPVRVRCWSSYV